MTTVEHSRLGSALQVARGRRWAFGANGDPYAMLLCGHDDDPWHWYEHIRASGPWFRSRTGTWVTTSHTQAVEVLDDPAFTRAWSSAPDWAAPFAGIQAAAPPDPLPDRETLVRQYAGLMPTSAARFDLMRDFAWEGALRGLAAQLGLSSADTGRLDAHASATRVSPDAVLSPQQLLVTERAIAALADAPGGAAVLGVELAANTVCRAILATCRTEGLADRLAADPELSTRIATETFRAEPPVHLERRTALEDRELACARITAGSEVVVAVAAANRDPQVFADPGRFDPDRPEAPAVLSADRGCRDGLAGFVVAHVEAALRAAAQTLPRLSVAGPVIHRRRSPVLRGISRCPVEI
ncbi:cytochrome P450 [Streptomyces noursei]|uniref:cytochrome P450 family protein n=2 Tax=Streptomyces noursei TaxID=1971 RepID=UPI0033ED7D83